MLKVTDSGHNHCNAVFVAVVDGFVVADASTGLNNSIDALLAGNFNTVGKWEECVGSHNSALQVEIEVVSLFDGLLERVDA